MRRSKMTKKCKHDVFYYCDKAEKGGLKVKFNFQGHPIIEAKDSSLMLPRNLNNPGTECAIRKWLLRLGIVLIIVFAFVWFL